MSRRIVFLVLSAAAWCGFVAITVWTMAFLAGVALPRTVDGPRAHDDARAVAIDLALLLLFAVQHSVMARRPAKAWLRRRVPVELERTTYVLATNLCLALLLALWQPWDQQIWHVEGVAASVLWTLCAAGWVLAIAATFAVDHLELVGLRQAGWALARDPARACRPAGRRAPRHRAAPVDDGAGARVLGHPADERARTCSSPSPPPATSPSGSRSRSATSAARSGRRTTRTPPASPRSCPGSAGGGAPSRCLGSDHA